MADQEEDPEQIKLMKRMVELSEARTELAKQRTQMAAERSRMSEERTQMSAERSQMSEERTQMSEERSEMSEHRSYLSAERTLSVWIRTALALMAAGIAVDRFALLLRHPTAKIVTGHPPPHTLSTLGGAALVAFGTAMALVSGIRYVLYAKRWQRNHARMPWHGPYLAFAYAILTVIFGIGLLVVLLTFAQ